MPLPVATKVLLGPKTTGGLGAGGKPETEEVYELALEGFDGLF